MFYFVNEFEGKYSKIATFDDNHLYTYFDKENRELYTREEMSNNNMNSFIFDINDYCNEYDSEYGYIRILNLILRYEMFKMSHSVKNEIFHKGTEPVTIDKIPDKRKNERLNHVIKYDNALNNLKLVCEKFGLNEKNTEIAENKFLKLTGKKEYLSTEVFDLKLIESVVSYRKYLEKYYITSIKYVSMLYGTIEERNNLKFSTLKDLKKMALELIGQGKIIYNELI